MSAPKDPNKEQIELERVHRQKVESEKSAREQRRQKRLLRNEFLNTDEIKQELGTIDWSKREILREFNRLKALRKKEKRSKIKRSGAKYSFRGRKGSFNTEDESDLFENPEDFEWPEVEITIGDAHQQEALGNYDNPGRAKQATKSTASGRAVTKKEKDDEDASESLKIIMEANVYRLLGTEEKGMEEMKILYGNPENDMEKDQLSEKYKGNLIC